MPEILAEIGEFALIHRFHKLLKKEGVRCPEVTLGIGDDCASFLPDAGYEILVTCDCMVEGRHYLPEYISPLDLGRRAMAVNISDIGAMGGQPLYAVVSLGLKADTPVTELEDMYRGFLTELNPFRASIIGGNLTRTGDGMFINITLMGKAKKGKIIRRSTAEAGDAILVTGYPGQAAAGLQLLLNAIPGEDISDHPLVRAYNIPCHRAREGEAIAHSGYATSMIDISDGFLGDLGHICQRSGVGAVLDQEKLPVSEDLRKAASDLGRDPYNMFLRQSDDYELIITCRSEHVSDIRSAIVALSDIIITEVGRITDSEGKIEIIGVNGSRYEPATGWDHFTDN